MIEGYALKHRRVNFSFIPILSPGAWSLQHGFILQDGKPDMRGNARVAIEDLLD